MSHRFRDRKQGYIKIPLSLGIHDATMSGFDDYTATQPLASGGTESNAPPPLETWDGPEVEIPPNEDSGP